MSMRASLVVGVAGVLLWFLPAASGDADLEGAGANPPDLLGEAKESLPDTDLPLGLTLGGDGTGGSGPGSDGSGSGSDVDASLANGVLVPVGSVTKGLVELGLELLNGFFVSIASGAETFGAAAQTIAGAPVASAAIAGSAILTLGLLGLLLGALHRYGGLGAIPLFSRIAKDDLLDNRVRNQIFELIQQNPGINVSEVARRLDIAWGTATHHLQKLRGERLVTIRIQGHQKCYFPNGGSYTPQEMTVLSATKNPTARRIAEFLVQRGPTPHQDISVSLGLSPALVSFHLQKLIRAGLVARERVGRRSIFTPLESNLAPTPRPMVHSF